MPNTILSLLSSSGKISIIDERNKNPIMQNLKIKSVEINNYADVSNLPLGDTQLTSVVIYQSTQRSDLGAGKIISPTKVIVTSFSSDVSVTSSVFSVLADLESSIQIITRSVIIPHLVISEIIVIQSPEMTDSVQINITLQQTDSPFGNQFSPAQSGDDTLAGVAFQTLKSLQSTVDDFVSQISNTLGF
jgi:hypothetical protein